MFEPGRIETFLRAWNLFAEAGVTPALLYTQEKWFSGGALTYTTQKIGSVEADDLATANHVGNQVFAPRTHFLEAGLFDENLPAWQDLELFIRMLRRFGTGRLVDVPSYRFDVSPRPDRVSASAVKVREAVRIVSERHFEHQRRKRQLLALQMFNAYYSFMPTTEDLRRFVSLGIWPGGLYQMARARVRHRR